MLLTALLMAAAMPTGENWDRDVIRPSEATDSRPECQELRRQIRAGEPARKELLAQRGARPHTMKLVMRRLTMTNGCVVPPPEAFHPAYLLPGRADAPPYRPAVDAAPPPR